MIPSFAFTYSALAFQGVNSNSTSFSSNYDVCAKNMTCLINFAPESSKSQRESCIEFYQKAIFSEQTIIFYTT